MRIPFDNVVLAAVTCEIQAFIGGVVQDIRQPDGSTLTLGIYGRGDGGKGAEGMLLICCDPNFGRVHFVTKRPQNSSTPPAFCSSLRSRLMGAKVVGARQVARDRILLIQFRAETGDHELILELIGSRSNIVLTEAGGAIVSICRRYPGKHARLLGPGSRYRYPEKTRSEFLVEPILSTPREWMDFRASHPESVSTFFRTLSLPDREIHAWEAQLVVDSGAYPLPIEGEGVRAVPRASISVALEQYSASALLNREIEETRSNLVGQLDRVLLARDVAVKDIDLTLRSGIQAGKWQLSGELLLAYGGELPHGATELRAQDYDGHEITIALDPELDFKKNAEAYFTKAKRAKGRVGGLTEHRQKLQLERAEIQDLRRRVAATVRLDELRDLQAIARSRRWLMVAPVTKNKEGRPLGGHRIREVFAPGGARILVGENAESNDYLTLRVAKPNDIWLHVRGSASAHVVIRTENQPDKIGRDLLLFAARIAVQHSPSKHAGYVPVDYTLKKYVRKPRGAPQGTALYTQEKTVHIES